MKAAYFYGGSREKLRLAIEEAPTPAPGSDEVLVRVVGTGVCRTDLEFRNRHVPTEMEQAIRKEMGASYDDAKFRIVLGHEPSGVVEAVGAHVSGVRRGDRVIGQPVELLTDPAHVTGIQTRDRRFFGSSTDGVFREMYIARGDQVHLVPRSFPLAESAILADAFSTPFYALTRRVQIERGDWVAIIGVGGIGFPGAVMAMKMGARVVAIDVNDWKLAAIKERGAVAAIHLGKLAIDEERAKREGRARALASAVQDQLRPFKVRAFRVVVDFSGAPDSQELGLQLTAPGGTLVLVGINQEREIAMHGGHLTYLEKSVVGSLGCPPREFPALVRFIEQNGIDPKEFVSRRFAPEDLDTIFDEWGKDPSVIRQLVVWSE